MGKVLETTAVHTKDGQTTTVIEKYTYEHAGKPLSQTHQINSGNIEYLAKNTYDALGQLEKKKTGGQRPLPVVCFQKLALSSAMVSRPRSNKTNPIFIIFDKS